MEKKGEMHKFFLIMMGLMAFALVIAVLWEHIPAIKEYTHAILDPTAGMLIKKSVVGGSLAVFFIIAFFTTVVQKYTTDQETLRELKKEHKRLQEETKKYREDPKKLMELQKEIFPLTGEMMKVSMKGSLFTIIPFILLYRWFGDFYATLSVQNFVVNHWLVTYLISLLVFSGILRKVLKVA